MSSVKSPAPVIGAIFIAKGGRTFCYGFLGIVLPVYLDELGVGAVGIGVAVTLTLAGSAALTWGVRRPAERFGGRPVLLVLAALTAIAACLLLVSREPWVVVFAAMVGNVAVGAGETGPFLSIEQVMIARAAPASRRTKILSVYNLLGYAAAACGSAAVGVVGSYRALFAAFLVAAGVQALSYLRLPVTARVGARGVTSARPSTALIRKLAALFSLDSFAGGFVLQSLVAYYLHTRFGLALDALGRIFFVAQMLTAASLLLAGRLAGRFGLLNTMVFSHLVSNVLLIGVAVAPTATVAVALLFARQLLSQIDVPTRQAYVMAVVEDHEREAAATTTTLWRTVAQAVTPALTGVIMQAVALGAPFVLGGGLKIVYDLLLYRTFKDVKLRSEHE